MQYNHFGEFLKEIRTINNISIEGLADGICSTRQLMRIEKGENDPSLYVLHNLSIKLNIDLQEYYRIHFSSGNFLAEEYKKKFQKFIIDKAIDKLQLLINQMEEMNEFQSGENLQYVFYGKAICSSSLHKNYNLSNEYCFKGLYVEDPNFHIDNETNKIFSNIGLTLINLIASNYGRLNERILSFKFLNFLFEVLDNFIFNSPFPMYRSLDFQNKLYQGVTNNLSWIFCLEKKYDNALDMVEKGITLSLKENCMRFLPELISRKADILYNLQRYEESYESYEICLGLYKLCRTDKNIKSLQDEINSRFPLNNLQTNNTAEL